MSFRVYRNIYSKNNSGNILDALGGNSDAEFQVVENVYLDGTLLKIEERIIELFPFLASHEAKKDLRDFLAQTKNAQTAEQVKTVLEISPLGAHFKKASYISARFIEVGSAILNIINAIR